MTTKVKRNENMGKLQAGYLFPEVRSSGEYCASVTTAMNCTLQRPKAACGRAVCGASQPVGT